MTKNPNVIMILTDDQGYWSLGCTGNKEIRTPNIDAPPAAYSWIISSAYRLCARPRAPRC